MFRKDLLNGWWPASRIKIWLGLGIFLTVALAGYVPASLAQVDVTIEITGTAEPDASLTATATASENGTPVAIQSISWSQTGGATASINPATANPTTVMLGSESAFKEELIHVLMEPPIGADQLPPNVPVPPEEFPGGLQNRFQVVAINPFALEEAAKVTIMAEVTTSSGVFEGEAEIHTMLPWKVKADLNNQATGIPILFHGKDQATYNWTLSLRPWNSSATLMEGTSQNPELIPDIRGQYRVSVKDLATDRTVNIDVYAGTWQGMITGQDMDGRPTYNNCRRCHREAGRAPFEVFEDWAQTGHAEILTNNLNTSPYYSQSCFPCHTVGYDLDVDNYGVDDVGDYMGFLGSGLLGSPSPDNWTTMLAEFPIVARASNVQCENCHGPQSTQAHNNRGLRSRTAVMGTDPRANISSNVCAVCHGEPLRHARFQQWQLSRHANYELAVDEGDSGNCSRCHTGNGFLTWLPVLLGEVPGDPTASITVNWTADAVQPQTCATCHDPHNIGTTSGNNPNATVRISDVTPLLTAGFVAPAAPGENEVGRGAMCMTCHNTRRGLRNDNEPLTDPTRAPHGGVQADLLMGQNAYFVDLGPNQPSGYPEGLPGSHANTITPADPDRSLKDTCTTCHMEQTPPPDLLAYNLGGTNHTFFASPTICTNCHEQGRLEVVQGTIAPLLETLKADIEAAILALMTEQITAGNIIDLNGDATITDPGDIAQIELTDSSRGRQAIAVTFTDATTVGPLGLNSVDVVDGNGVVLGELYDFADESLPKAGWNYYLVSTDKSLGVHNFFFALAALNNSITALGGAPVAP